MFLVRIACGACVNTAQGTYHAYAKFYTIYVRDVVTELGSVLPHTNNPLKNPVSFSNQGLEVG